MKYKQISNRSDLQWDEIVKHVSNAFVYLDDAAAECLHWHGGLQRLLTNGAISIENFSPYVKAESCTKKAVFILMTPLTGLIWKYLMIVIKANKFQHCIVMTSLPAKFHYPEENELEQSFIVIENRILNWIEGMNSSANIYHIPLFSAHISPNLFIMPSFAKSFSIFNCGLCEMNRKRTEELSFRHLDIDMETSLKHLAYSFHSLLDTYQMKGDFFSLGPLSSLLASELENLSQQQKKKSTQSKKSSVVIVDRILDLAGPLSQSYETMFDKILFSLPHLSGHVFDVCVNTEDLASCKNDTVFGRPLLAPGCICHKNNLHEESCLNAILYKKPREALIEVNRNIVESAVKEGINCDATSILTTEVLRKKIISFKENPKLLKKFSGLLQQALAVIQALEFSSSNNIDNLVAIEKALLQYLTTSSEEVLSQIMQMICERKEMNYKMEEILMFLAFFYMLTGETDLDNESSMQATLMEVFFQDEDISEIVSLFVDNDAKDDEIILNAVKTLFAVFKKLGTIRKRLKKYNSIFETTNPAFPSSYNPLLKQLLSDIFDTTLTDISDLEFHSVGLKDYIKTGFSLFMNVTKPQPRDNPVIFLMVLGGITPSEMKMIEDCASRHKETEIIVGSTQVLSPSDVLKDIGSIVKNLSSNYAQAYDKESI